ncbi:arabinogalactan endo-1,4-beta-galactosidase [Paenibacillus sp. ov031]|uniref:glycoside hydrolase family 53 protein n=1 Tax=Paenibacillus sp. ov031 TaxID=1761879 RepID=UPI00091E3599|nr:arabinogalactan endo-1,4-beta-galactosidase [Paenibacillus sp. ov031]SHN52299.1 arabinogalactan endo-1,4-beta-galactosidase [Paenibacillus sp. ov031]
MSNLKEEAFVLGMDVSFMDEIEQHGGTYRDEHGQQADLLTLLKLGDANAIRLRIWNDPVGGFCNLERTVAVAKRIKEQGLQFLLDFHYSDRWADPANQWKPKAWEKLSYEELQREVCTYTADVLRTLKEHDALPDMVQVGNEITPGMLWDEGHVGGEEHDTDEQWERFAGLVKYGIAAVKSVDSEIKIMIHIDRGGDNAESRKFYDRFEALGVEFDIIGLSYYPWWHGTLDALRDNLHDLAERYGKPINVVETAYPWTLEQPEGHEWILNQEELLLPGYPASVEGQTRYLKDLLQIIREVPGGLGAGFYYWEPAWIPSKEEWSVGHPNNWGNLTMFDFKGQKLQSFSALKAGEGNDTTLDEQPSAALIK